MKRKQHQSRARRPQKTHTADPSVELGLRYFAAYQTWALIDEERLAIQETLYDKYPQAPVEICIPNVPNPNALRSRDDIRQKESEPRRSKLITMLIEEESKRRKIDHETGYTAKETEADQLHDIANALRVLWIEEPATTVCGVALKLRAWMDIESPRREDGAGARLALAALADAERLCGVRHMTMADHPISSAGFAERTKADFSAVG